MAVQQLAALKVSVVEVAHAEVCLGHVLKKVFFLHAWCELSSDPASACGPA